MIDKDNVLWFSVDENGLVNEISENFLSSFTVNHCDIYNSQCSGFIYTQHNVSNCKALLQSFNKNRSQKVLFKFEGREMLPVTLDCFYNNQTSSAPYLFIVKQGHHFKDECDNTRPDSNPLNHLFLEHKIGEWTLDFQTKLIQLSPVSQVLSQLGSHCSLESFFINIHPIDRRQLIKKYLHARLHKGSLNLELRLLTSKGIQWFNIQSEPVKNHPLLAKFSGIARDITIEKQQLNDLQVGIDSRDVALSVGNVGMWHGEVNLQGEWVWKWNSVVDEMFGLKCKFGGSNVLANAIKSIHHDDRERVANAIAKSLQYAEAYEESYRVENADGHNKYIYAKGIIRFDLDGKISHFDGVCIDETAKHNTSKQLKTVNEVLENLVAERTKELILAKDSAEAANNAKSEFLSMMSHELRNPINTIVGSLDLLKLIVQDAEGAELVEAATRSTSGLLRVLDDVLDFQKINSGKLTLTESIFSIFAIIHDIVRMFLPAATNMGIALKVFEDADTPRFVLGDEKRVRQILYNLIGNAIKFTEPQNGKGKVKIEIHCINRTSEQCTISFRIKDNGFGIDQVTQKKLFSPFIQADSTITRDFGGTGLGLSICQKLINLMNGKLTLDSALGVGSDFAVELSFAVKHQNMKTIQELSLDRKQILCVGESESPSFNMLNMIKHIASYGGNVSYKKYSNLCNGKNNFDAYVLITDEIEKYKKHFDLIELKSEHSNILVGLGAKVKPDIFSYNNIEFFNFDSITRLHFIELLCESSNIHKALKASHNIGNHNTYELRDAATAACNVLVVEDNPFNQKILKKQLEKLGLNCDIAINGEEGVSFWLNGNYSLILTDCNMPVVDGYEMAKKIRILERENKLKQIPIVAITGASTRDDKEKCIMSGMSDYLLKPVKLVDIKSAVDKWISG